MVSKENSIPNSQVASDTQTHMQGQFPTYTVVTSPHTRVTQMLTNVAKPSLVTDIDDPIKSPVNKTSIISIVKGTGASNQQIYVRKNANDLTVEGQNRNISNDVQLIHPRTPIGETSNHHLYVMKNNGPPNELTNESQNRNVQSGSQIAHHARVSAAESFSPNMSMNNQAPPSYIDATQYSHREVAHSPFQIQSPFEVHEPLRPIMHQQGEQKNQLAHEAGRSFHQHNEKKNHVHDLTLSMHQQADKKNPKRHESSRPLHHQSEKKVRIKHDSSRPVDELGEHKNQQLHESNRALHQQGQQKHETIRSIQQHESNRQMQQHGEQIRETGRTLYHLTDQKNQQIHYQLGDQTNQQLHESARPLYLLGDQKSQYESGRQLHQQLEQKGQQMHDPNRSLYPHNDKKKQQLHDSSRIIHQHNEQKNQHGHDSLQPLHQLTEQKNQHESMRSSHQHNDQKSQQIHVHKVHHGNARVKYVEFKPVQEGLKYRQLMHHAPHSYNPNQKQTLYYSNHLANNPGSHHLTVQTPTHSPLSPLHSPPALRPPPTIPSGTAWHSPPSLVPSPEVRPRFDFISSPQPMTTGGSPCPVQVANMVPHKMFSGKGGKPVNISGNHNILLPRLPGNYQLSSPGHQTSHASVVPRGKAAFNQTPCSNSPGGQQPLYDTNQPNFSQTGIPSSSVASTVTVTMTYIPIPTSTKDKFVYVPVNSGQPVVLYQNQQANGKPVLLPPQVLQGGKNVPNSKDVPKDSPYTTVRLQGLVNCGIPKNSNFTTVVGNSQNSPMKGFKYHLANTPMSNHSLKKPPGFFKLDQKSSAFNMDFLDFESEKNNLTPINNKDFILGSEAKQKEEFNAMTDIKLGNQAEVMTLINNQLRLVPPHVGINNQAAHVGMKRNSMGIPMSNNNEFILQSPLINMHEKTINEEPTGSSMKDTNLEISTNDLKEKKKRGRPPVEKITKKGKRKEKGKSKLSPMQGNLLTVLSGGQLVSNQVLIDAYKKQQQVQLQKHYFDDPLIKLPDLSPTPESWTSEDVHKYLISTDCACYADAIKAEEMDGKSFLLITREALMDFLGIKLGPALKIAGHAAGLRARQRIYCLTLQEQNMPVLPKEKKTRLPSKSNQKQTESGTSNSIISEDISVISTVQNIVPPELVIPNISILPAPSDESILKPLLEPSHTVTEHCPVILKVPDPLPILGDSSSSKLPEVTEINGETLEELQTEEKKPSENLPVTDNVVNESNTNDTGKIHLELQNMTDNKLDFSQKTLSPSQIHTLTEIELDGITHENS